MFIFFLIIVNLIHVEQLAFQPLAELLDSTAKHETKLLRGDTRPPDRIGRTCARLTTVTSATNRHE